MAKVKGRKNTRKERNYRWQANTSTALPLLTNLGPFPERMRTVMLYQETTIIAAATTFSIIFSGNNLYDPNYSGTGLQPQSFDQYSAFYNYYSVIGCKAKFRVANLSTTTGIQFCLLPKQAPSAPSYGTALAHPYVKSGMCDTLGSGSGITDLHCSATTVVINGRDPLASSDNVALFTAAPGLPWYFILTGETLSLLSASVTVSVELRYDVVLTGLKTISFS